VKPDLAQLVATWQRDLRLLDWRLQVEYVRDLTGPNGAPVYGLCYRFVDAKRARIEIRDPATPVTSRDPSVEETLIHELLHLHFAPLASDGAAAIAAEEQAVWAITEAMVARGAGREAQMIARAMAAHAKTFAPVRRMGGSMDPKLIAAALEALIAGDKEKCAEILKSIVTSSAAGGGGELPEAPPAQEAPVVDPTKPAMQQAAASGGIVSRVEFERMQTERLLDRDGAHLTTEQRAFAADLAPAAARSYLATVPAPSLAATPAAAPAAAPAGGSTRAAGAPASVERAEFDAFKVETFLDRNGAHLTSVQRTFALGLTLEKARAYVATVPATSAPTAPRRSAPTTGARAMSTDPTLAEVDRRMGLAPLAMQAVSRDPVTGRLQLSNIATNPVVSQKAGA